MDAAFNAFEESRRVGLSPMVVTVQEIGRKILQVTHSILWPVGVTPAGIGVLPRHGFPDRLAAPERISAHNGLKTIFELDPAGVELPAGENSTALAFAAG